MDGSLQCPVGGKGKSVIESVYEKVVGIPGEHHQTEYGYEQQLYQFQWSEVRTDKASDLTVEHPFYRGKKNFLPSLLFHSRRPSVKYSLGFLSRPGLYCSGARWAMLLW